MGPALELIGAAMALALAAGAGQVREVHLDESFRLRVGESARIQGEDLKVAFERVSADSRCPKGEECVTAGDATVRIWLQKGSRPRETRALHTSGRDETRTGGLDYTVRLLGLDPGPVTGHAIDRRRYEATLEVARGSSAPTATQ